MRAPSPSNQLSGTHKLQLKRSTQVPTLENTQAPSPTHSHYHGEQFSTFDLSYLWIANGMLGFATHNGPQARNLHRSSDDL